jgi:hypothetical protein
MAGVNQFIQELMSSFAQNPMFAPFVQQVSCFHLSDGNFYASIWEALELPQPAVIMQLQMNILEFSVMAVAEVRTFFRKVITIRAQELLVSDISAQLAMISTCAKRVKRKEEFTMSLTCS